MTDKLKPTVKYKKEEGVLFLLEGGAYLYPIDHPSEHVSNTKGVLTSQVMAHDKDTGRIETRNTVYLPE
jgi:hypothetical protein